MALNTHKLTKLEQKIRVALLWFTMSLYVWVTLVDPSYRLPAALYNPLTLSVSDDYSRNTTCAPT